MYNKQNGFDIGNIQMKVCTKCKVRKRSTSFYKNKITKDGLRSECKECSKEITRKTRLTSKEKKVSRSPAPDILFQQLTEIRKQCEDLLIRLNKAIKDAKQV